MDKMVYKYGLVKCGEGKKAILLKKTALLVLNHSILSEGVNQAKITIMQS